MNALKVKDISPIVKQKHVGFVIIPVTLATDLKLIIV